jgi:ribonucleoside-diphosphate reductase alpha chain
MLSFKKYFTKTINGNVLDNIPFIKKHIGIKGISDEYIYELNECEFPIFWSDNACKIVASKYFNCRNQNPEHSVKQVISRIVDRLYNYALRDGYMDKKNGNTFRDELAYLLTNQYGAFSSPVWINLGTRSDKEENTSSCFTLCLEDSLESLLEVQRLEVLIAKNGGGAGLINSQIRSAKDIISSGCNAPGPLAFMKARDAWASVILCGGIIRKFPKMDALDYWHILGKISKR